MEQPSRNDATTPMPSPSGARLRVPVDVFTSSKGTLHRSIRLAELFAFKSALNVGRDSTCDICLPHPSVSRRHAALERGPDGLRVRDCGSVNGVLVGGRRLKEPALVRDGERFSIGPYLFCLDQDTLHSLDSSHSLRLEARGLEKTVPTPSGTRQLLANVNLAIEPGEFTCLLGPSGSGKSTLMDCLNGRRPATGGRLLANGEDFYELFDSFRQSLGYVPQRDIVHAQLPVARALEYTARLRLPPDTSPEELAERVREVMRLMELEPHRDTLIGQLSGGQVKRVSLGAELMAQPCLLYIDEATSGLDSGTEARMMRLFRQLAQEGKSVLCITHNVDNVDLCHLVVILTSGRLVFVGPPQEALTYFHVQRMREIYDRLASKSAPEWEREWSSCSLCQEYVTRRLATAPEGSVMNLAAPVRAAAAVATPTPPKPLRQRRALWHQFRVLTARYVELIWRDQRTLRLLFWQAPIVCFIILLGFAGKPFSDRILAGRALTDDEHKTLADWHARLSEAATPELRSQSVAKVVAKLARDEGDAAKFQDLVRKLPSDLTVADILEKADVLLKTNAPLVPERFIINPTYTYLLACLLVIVVLWFGCNNAAREIAKEDAIYARERAVNLHILPYLSGKFLVLSAISAFQVFTAMVVIYGGMEVLRRTLGYDPPAPEYVLGYAMQFAALTLLAMTGVALGLMLSAAVSSPDRASTLLPYVMIPQIILCGGLLPMTSEPMRTVAIITSPAYWAFRAVRAGETELPQGFPWYVNYHDDVGLSAGALLAQMATLLLTTAWLLKKKDAQGNVR